MKKVLRIGAGIGLILIGIVGLIMPIMPGWVFIIPGLMILGEYSKTIRRLLDWLRAKFEDARNVAMPKSPPAAEPSATRPSATRPSATRPSATIKDQSGQGQ